MLNAVIRVGQFNDPQSEEMLSKFLIERRNAIVARYLQAVNPIVDVQLSLSGILTFKNAAVDEDVAAAPADYVVAWSRFDNASGATTELGVTTGKDTRVPAPADLPDAVGAYIRVGITAQGGPESWNAPVQAYFLRETTGWKLVGFERVPGGNPPEPRQVAGREVLRVGRQR